MGHSLDPKPYKLDLIYLKTNYDKLINAEPILQTIHHTLNTMYSVADYTNADRNYDLDIIPEEYRFPQQNSYLSNAIDETTSSLIGKRLVGLVYNSLNVAGRSTIESTTDRSYDNVGSINQLVGGRFYIEGREQSIPTLSVMIEMARS